MSSQKIVLELYAIHDNYSKEEVVSKVGDKIVSKNVKKRRDGEIYSDVYQKKELRNIPSLIEKYLGSAGTLLDGSFYGAHEHELNLTYHIGGSTVKISMSPLRAGSDTGDPEGCSWAVFGYNFSADFAGKDSKKVSEKVSKELKRMGFEIVDKERLSNSRDHYVGF